MQYKDFDTLKDLWIYSTTNFSQETSFGYVGEKPYSYAELGKKIEEMATLLSQHGVLKGDKVALLSHNMPNWVVSYFAAVVYGRIIIPILPDFSENEVKNVLEHSDSKVLFVSTRLLYKIPKEMLNSFKLAINIDDFSIINQVEELSEPIVYKEADITPSPEDIASIIYTSGTTGKSKGVVLTHRNLCKHLYSAQILWPGFKNDVWLSILPLSHTLECSLSMMLPMTSGSSVYFINKPPVPSVLLSALKIVRPTTMLSVPMIIEKIYFGKILPTLEAKSITKMLHKTTIGRKLLYYMAGKKLKETFGGRLRFFGIGGAKLDPIVERFLAEAKFPYAIGYGLTETAPLLAGAVPGKTAIGTTGPAVYGVTLKINNPDPVTGEGEIWAKGENVMAGYYKNPEETQAAITEDGWFRTKDLGVIDRRGRVHIRGRLSSMILGPSGENIYPEEIESIINTHSMVEESLVTQLKGKLVAIVRLSPEKLQALQEAKEDVLAKYYEKRDSILKNIEDKKSEAAQLYSEKKDELSKAFDDKIEQIKQEIFEYVNDRVNKYSKVSLVIDIPQEFEKTATLKIKRYLYQSSLCAI